MIPLKRSGLLKLAAFPLAFLLSAASSYQVPNGGNTTINEHGVCRVVSNNHPSGQQIFVPTNTGTEWTAFLNGLPTNVTADSCAPIPCNLPWGGTLADGASVTAYATTSGCGNAGCASETRTCTGGELSGSYQNQACGTSLCSQTFTASGTWTRPDTGTTVVARCVGGGGGGGEGTSTRRPKGGGGGGYSTGTYARTALAATVAVTVGGGGAGGNGQPGAGGNGGASSFGSHFTAGGGQGGAGSGSTTPTGGSGNTETGSRGGSLYPSTVAPQARTNAGGGGGASYSSSYQAGSVSTNGGNGGAGCEACTNPGQIPGGGGGSVRNGVAGAGARGQCWVTTSD